MAYEDILAALLPVAGGYLGSSIPGMEGASGAGVGAELGKGVGQYMINEKRKRDMDAIMRQYAGSAPGPFSMADATNNEAYKFANQEAQRAVTNSAAAKGGLLSSNALAEAQRTAAGLASQTQAQAYNQWLQNWQMRQGVAKDVAGMQLGASGLRGDNTAALGGSLGGVATRVLSDPKVLEAFKKWMAGGQSPMVSASPSIGMGGVDPVDYPSNTGTGPF